MLFGVTAGSSWFGLSFRPFQRDWVRSHFLAVTQSHTRAGKCYGCVPLTVARLSSATSCEHTPHAPVGQAGVARLISFNGTAVQLPLCGCLAPLPR